MTPERAKWWGSLPAEEKRVRCIIKHFEEDVKLAKAVLKRHHEACAAKVCMQTRKRAIKALRKQIAVRPWERKDVHSLHCPRCWNWIYANCYKPLYCDRCGQKLRWDYEKFVVRYYFTCVFSFYNWFLF